MAEIQIFLHSLSLANLGLNWLDIVIILVFAFYAYEGFEVGLLGALFDLLNFVLSFIIGLKFYSVVGGLITTHLAIPSGFANAIGFFTASFVSEFLLSILLRKPFLLMQTILFRRDEKKALAYLESFNKAFGIIPGCASAFILLSFLLTTVMSLPFSLYLKHSVTSSKFGNLLVINTQNAEKSLQGVFGGALNETLNFLTVKPEGNEMIDLHFKVSSPTPDEQAEEQMLALVNKERTSRGLSALTIDDHLREVAREHSKDMFVRGYFSHYTPEGLSPFDRLTGADIVFSYAGENLALAPNTQLAMQGLMNSPGHRANILSPNFQKIGIGVMDGGVYGEMFSQEFTD